MKLGILECIGELLHSLGLENVLKVTVVIDWENDVAELEVSRVTIDDNGFTNIVETFPLKDK